jgi:hypothetical protein
MVLHRSHRSVARILTSAPHTGHSPGEMDNDLSHRNASSGLSASYSPLVASPHSDGLGCIVRRFIIKLNAQALRERP